MEKLIMKRGTGKTYQLIKMAHDSGAHIVCSNPRDVECMSMEMGFRIHPPIAYYEFIQGKRKGKSTKGFMIDNVDLLLAEMSKDVPVLAITMREEA